MRPDYDYNRLDDIIDESVHEAVDTSTNGMLCATNGNDLHFSNRSDIDINRMISTALQNASSVASAAAAPVVRDNYSLQGNSVVDNARINHKNEANMLAANLSAGIPQGSNSQHTLESIVTLLQNANKLTNSNNALGTHPSQQLQAVNNLLPSPLSSASQLQDDLVKASSNLYAFIQQQQQQDQVNTANRVNPVSSQNQALNNQILQLLSTIPASSTAQNQVISQSVQDASHSTSAASALLSLVRGSQQNQSNAAVGLQLQSLDTKLPPFATTDTSAGQQVSNTLNLPSLPSQVSTLQTPQQATDLLSQHLASILSNRNSNLIDRFQSNTHNLSTQSYRQNDFVNGQGLLENNTSSLQSILQQLQIYQAANSLQQNNFPQLNMNANLNTQFNQNTTLGNTLLLQQLLGSLQQSSGPLSSYQPHQTEQSFSTIPPHIFQHSYASAPITSGSSVSRASNLAEQKAEHEHSTTATNGQKRSSKRNVDPFPVKLYNLLMDAERNGQQDIVMFTPSGNAFVVNKPIPFVKDITPKYFRISNFTSFRRQLYVYDFHRTKEGHIFDAYSNPSFKKGHPELLKSMKRKNK